MVGHQHCCVPQCTNDARYDPDRKLSFHKIPTDKKRRKEWFCKIRRHPGPDFSISNATRVCSAHFSPDDLRKTLTGKRCLKPGAVPSIFAWNSPTQRRRQSLKNRVMPKFETGSGQLASGLERTDHGMVAPQVEIDEEDFVDVKQEVEESAVYPSFPYLFSQSEKSPAASDVVKDSDNNLWQIIMVKQEPEEGLSYLSSQATGINSSCPGEVTNHDRKNISQSESIGGECGSWSCDVEKWPSFQPCPDFFSPADDKPLVCEEITDVEGDSANEFYFIADVPIKYSPILSKNVEELYLKRITQIYSELWYDLQNQAAVIYHKTDFMMLKSYTVQFIQVYETANPSIKCSVSVCPKSLEVTVLVHRSALPSDHKIWDTHPRVVSDSAKLISLLAEISKMNVCQGNPDEDFKDYDLKDLAYNEPDFGAGKGKRTYSRTIRHKKCQLLVPALKCPQCGDFRKCLRRCKRKELQTKSFEGNVLTYATPVRMRKKQLFDKISALEKDRNRLMALNEQLKRRLEGCSDNSNSVDESCRPEVSGSTAQSRLNEQSHRSDVSGSKAQSRLNKQSCRSDVSGSTAQSRLNEQSCRSDISGSTVQSRLNEQSCRPEVSGSTVQSRLNEQSCRPEVSGSTVQSRLNKQSCRSDVSGSIAQSRLNKQSCRSDISDSTVQSRLNEQSCRPEVSGSTVQSRLNEEPWRPEVGSSAREARQSDRSCRHKNSDATGVREDNLEQHFINVKNSEKMPDCLGVQTSRNVNLKETGWDGLILSRKVADDGRIFYVIDCTRTSNVNPSELASALLTLKSRKLNDGNFCYVVNGIAQQYNI